MLFQFDEQFGNAAVQLLEGGVFDFVGGVFGGFGGSGDAKGGGVVLQQGYLLFGVDERAWLAGGGVALFGLVGGPDGLQVGFGLVAVHAGVCACAGDAAEGIGGALEGVPCFVFGVGVVFGLAVGGVGVVVSLDGLF